MKELRVEIVMKKHLKMKVAGSRMRWTGHVQRMGEDRLSKRAWKAEEGGRRRRGRPKLRWKDCIKRDLERAGTNGQEWKTTAEDREMENINNESGRNNQVTWTPPPQGNKGKKKKHNMILMNYAANA